MKDNDFKKVHSSEKSENRKRVNCCFVFSLQTGTTLIVWFDAFFFIVLLCLIGFENRGQRFWPRVVLNMLTDGVMVLL